jgi:uncharacterized membrane protein YbhN (UPF0104 family)
LKRRSSTGSAADAIKDIGLRRTLVDRVVLIATISVFCAAIVVLFNQFRSVSLNAVLASLATMPRHQVYAAMGLTVGSYLLLTGYDFLALRYVRRQLRFRDVVFTSFAAFVFSNNLGFQLLSGGSMRYRIYSKLGLQGGEIFAIVAFCTFTYALGVIAVGGMVFVFEPAEVASLLSLSRPVISAVGLALLGFIAAYLTVAARRHGPIALRRFRVRPPTLVLAIAQVALASIDAALAGTVFYVLLPTDFNLGFASYLGVYLIAATTSVVSLVPGGLGVFETAIMLMTAPLSKAAALGAFLAYRMIYFVTPLVVASVWFLLHETRRMTETS